MYELFLAKAKEKDITKKKRVQMEKDVQSLRAGLVSNTCFLQQQRFCYARHQRLRRCDTLL
ncbi:MAG TPA: hypothetical protein VIV60_12575 [Polyangiaceae bacterium]